jgi:hypothetical protein
LSDETKSRQIRCHYDGLLAKDDAFINGYIYWYVPGPNEATMLAVDVKDLTTKKGFVLDDTRSIFTYKAVSFKNKKYKPNMYYTKSGSKYNLVSNETKPAGTLYEKLYTKYCFYKRILA